MLKSIFKYILRAVVIVIAALFIGAIPFPNAQVADQDNLRTTRIYVLSNGFHSDIAIPRSNGENLSQLGVAETDFPVALEQTKYWAVGWGSITAYTSLLAVSDLTVGIAAKALSFDEAVMHITPLGALEPSERVFAFDLTAEQYRKLLTAMRSWFLSTAPMDVTQGFGDRFYPAQGSFTPWYTCNTWTGRRLREIGILIGSWTPTSQSLEFGLSRSAAK